MNDNLTNAVRSTESLLKHQTRQAILDASDQASNGIYARSVPSTLKRRRFTDSPSDVSTKQDSFTLDEDVNKRPCLNEHATMSPNESQPAQSARIKHWLVLDLVTAGRQESDLGRDQTPIVQFVMALGQFSSKTITDRLVINVHSDSYIRQTTGNTNEVHIFTNQTTPQQDNSDSQNTVRVNAVPVSPTDPVNKDQSGLPIGSEPKTTTSEKVEMKDLYALNGCVSLTVEAMQCVTRNSQANIPQLSASSFEDALDAIENWLKSHGIPIGEDPSQCSLVLILDGHKPLRNVLHSEAAYRGLDRTRLGRTPWSCYVDLISWCSCATPAEPESKTTSVSTLSDAIEALQLNLNSCFAAGSMPIKLDLMVAVVQKLVESGIPLYRMETIQTRYEHRVFSRNISLKDGQVVEVRQVPWSATPSIIAGFFAGLNLIPGGVAIRLTDGRRSNTAIVAFESVMNAQLALARHHHQLCGALLQDTTLETVSQAGVADKSTGKDSVAQFSPPSKPVMLQVYSATSKEFVQCAGCEQQSVKEFLGQLTNGEQVVVRVRGLPYTVTKKEILDFFLAVHATVLFDCQGIHLVAYPDRRPTGDAFVLFPDDKTATKALTRHKDYLGDRYVELFKASPSEMVQVCHNVSQQTHSSSKSQSSLLEVQGRNRTTVNPLGFDSMLQVISPYLTRGQQLALALKNFSPACPISPSISTGVMPTPMFPLGDVRSVLSDKAVPDRTLEQLFMMNSNMGLNQPNLVRFDLSASRPISALTGVSSLSQNPGGFGSKSWTEPEFKDLTDPTDPDCSFARPWPQGGVSAVLELSSLPLETSRHDVRLYLGPANFSKVYRMLRKEMPEMQTTSTWLLSLTDSKVAIQLIRDLVSRPFSVGAATGIVKTYPNVPTFTLYHVGVDKQLQLVPLDDPSLAIPCNRVHNLLGTLAQPQSHNIQSDTSQLTDPIHLTPAISSTPFLTRSNSGLQGAMTKLPVSTPVSNISSIPTDSMYNHLLKAIVSQSQVHDLKSPPCQLTTFNALSTGNLPIALGSMTTPSAPVISNTSNSLLPPPSNPLYGLSDLSGVMNNSITTLSLLPTSNSNACLVMITGAPTDATAAELNSIFRPIYNLLTAIPRFTLYQTQPNGTSNFLATFTSPLEAQAAAMCCPTGSLRNGRYTIGTACLVPPAVDPTGTASYNPSTSNLMLGSFPNPFL